ncbi:hypothetical protein Dda_6933 [Drechslerella dactyloides]|uniref:Uncharacterized protein n=1 Tax=Drechslerella dactyloides TaxID=74499 RepID=A0AAD6ITE8_DREDA|nr:hypothetical protein Dda_6933 [Drechslerella dactyloides]
MKLLGFTSILLFWILAGKALAHCRYWDGTAPFCDGSCPISCRTIATSKSGNGATCWFGHKALCNCCSGDGPCIPTQIETACYGIILICKNIEVKHTPSGKKKTTCATYRCGYCLDLSPVVEEVEGTVKEYGAPRRELSLESTHQDIIVRGYNTTEEEIERALVSNFGKKLSPEEMKNTTVLKIIPPDIRLIRENEGCPRVESEAIPQGRFQVQNLVPHYN